MKLGGARAERPAPGIGDRRAPGVSAPGDLRAGDATERIELLLAAGADGRAAGSAWTKAARRRADAVERATGDRREVGLTFAAAGLAALALASEPPASATADAVVDELADSLGVSRSHAAARLLFAALAETTLSDAAPRVVLGAQLGLVGALASIRGVSLWAAGADGSSVCVASAGQPAAAEASEGTVAASLLDADAVLVALPRSAAERARVAALLELVRPAVEAQIQRERRRETEAAEQALLAEAGERRRVRLGLDLHDGALQAVVALAADLRLFRAQLAAVVGDDHLEIVLGRVDDLEARLLDLERELRELAGSLQPRSLLARPFIETVHDEIEAFATRFGIATSVELDGAFDELTASQRLALMRIVQEALTNAREHGSASRIEVSLSESDDGLRLDVVDDGGGFDVAVALERAAARGRLGLAGMRERAALLGGSCSFESKPGGPTQVSARLPRWKPIPPTA